MTKILLIMVKQVIKRGRKKEPFRAEKLKRSIRDACRDIHVSGARAKTVVAKVSGPVLRSVARRKSVKASMLRAKVLAGLRKVEPAAAKAWLRHEERRRARRR